MKKYILFCAQEGNFQTRSMLIPYDLFMKCEPRVADLKTLRDHALNNVEFEHNGVKYIVDRLLIQNFTREGHCGHQDKMPFTQIINELTSYADSIMDDCYSHLYDKDWYDEAICDIASAGFNHLRNYCNFRNKTQYNGQSIEIVEGFLVLESENEKLNMPDIDTVGELMRKYFLDKIVT